MITAEEFLKDIRNIAYSEEEKLKVFARLHVEAALKAASENAKIEWGLIHAKGINKDSILNAYPLTNIK